MRANPRLLVGLSALEFVLFPMPVITLFWKDHIGMSLTQVMALQAAAGLSAVLLEFPSGYFADRVGFRGSMVVGAALRAAGWVAYAGAGRFATVVTAEVVLGAGSAFLSGADRALLWASLEATGRTAQYPRWEGRLRAAAQGAEAASAAVGGWLYSLAPRLPFWLTLPAAGLMLGSTLGLREPPHARAADRSSHVRRALRIVRSTLGGNRRLRAALALGVALSLSSFVMVWLIQPWMQTRGVPTVWFGPVWAGAHLWLAGVSLASARVAAALGARATLGACCLLVLVGYAGLAFTASPGGVAFYLCFMTLRGLQGPIIVMALQEEAPDEARASVLSLGALAFRVSFVVVGPAVGALVDRAGMETALATLAVVFTAAALGALVLFVRARQVAGAA